MIAVAASWGNSSYSKTANPYRSAAETWNYFSIRNLGDLGKQAGELIFDKGSGSSKQQGRKYVSSEFGGGYLYFTVYVGVYIDWGFIEVATTDGSGNSLTVCYDQIDLTAQTIEAEYDYRTILQHYYPGTTLQPQDDTGCPKNNNR